MIKQRKTSRATFSETKMADTIKKTHQNNGLTQVNPPKRRADTKAHHN